MKKKNRFDREKERAVDGVQEREKVAEGRRAFLKKAAYTAPGLMVLGQLSRPARSAADDFGGPPSDPHFQ